MATSLHFCLVCWKGLFVCALWKSPVIKQRTYWQTDALEWDKVGELGKERMLEKRQGSRWKPMVLTKEGERQKEKSIDRVEKEWFSHYRLSTFESVFSATVHPFDFLSLVSFLQAFVSLSLSLLHLIFLKMSIQQSVKERLGRNTQVDAPHAPHWATDWSSVRTFSAMTALCGSAWNSETKNVETYTFQVLHNQKKVSVSTKVNCLFHLQRDPHKHWQPLLNPPQPFPTREIWHHTPTHAAHTVHTCTHRFGCGKKNVRKKAEKNPDRMQTEREVYTQTYTYTHTRTHTNILVWGWKACCRRKWVLLCIGTRGRGRTLSCLRSCWQEFWKRERRFVIHTNTCLNLLLFITPSHTHTLIGPSVLSWGAVNPDPSKKGNVSVCVYGEEVLSALLLSGGARLLSCCQNIQFDLVHLSTRLVCVRVCE